MKFTRNVAAYILIVTTLILSACTSFTAQGINSIPTLTPSPQTATPTPGKPDVTGSPTDAPGETPWQVYTSDAYSYTVSYPGDWVVAVDPAVSNGADNSPENVTFSNGSGGLPNITIYALTELPPFTGYEKCQPTMVFRGLDACQVSNPAGQNPASELVIFHNGNQFFQIAFLYEDQDSLSLFDRFMTSFQFTKAIYNGPEVPVMKSYASKEYGFSVNYPADWSVDLQSAAEYGAGTNYEAVTFMPPSQESLANISIYASRGAAPYSGYENCEQNFVFRDLNACRISIPQSQIPATELLIFQKDDAYFEIAMQYFNQDAMETFDNFLTSFQFFDNNELGSQNGSPTPSSSPSTASCNLARFLSDVTIPDGTIVKPGELFLKKWRVENIGTCTWKQNYHLVFSSGSTMSGPVLVSLPEEVSPGETVDVLVNLTAPASPGSYTGYWKLADSSGTQFGVGSSGQDPLSVKIKVAAVPTDTPGMVRINFFEGATEAQAAGDLDVGETISYLLNVAAGQTMIARIDSPTQNVLLRIYGLSDGKVLLENSMGAGQNHWQGVVPSSQDYVIEAINRDEATHFTLHIVIPEKVVIPFQPGSISNSYHYAIQAHETHTFIWNVASGQTMNLELTSGEKGVVLALYGLQDGQIYLDRGAGQTSWSGEILTTQDYIIQVVSLVDTNTDFTLGVGINTY